MSRCQRTGACLGQRVWRRGLYGTVDVKGRKIAGPGPGWSENLKLLFWRHMEASLLYKMFGWHTAFWFSSNIESGLDEAGWETAVAL